MNFYLNIIGPYGIGLSCYSKIIRFSQAISLS